MEQTAAHAPAAESQWLTIRLGTQEFAINTLGVRELRGWSELAPVPQSEPYVSGLLDLRGIVIPVIDLALRLDLPAVAQCPTSVIVVIELNRGPVGLLVDQVCDLFSLANDALQFPGLPGNDDTPHFVKGALSLGSRIVNVISTERLAATEVAA